MEGACFGSLVSDTVVAIPHALFAAFTNVAGRAGAVAFLACPEKQGSAGSRRNLARTDGGHCDLWLIHSPSSPTKACRKDTWNHLHC
jgi:hypothetical protein